MGINIAIDGPAGAGKSTVSKTLARRLGYVYVDTGAMYRAIACYFLRQGLPAQERIIADRCREAVVTLRYENGEQRVLLNGEDITQDLRTPQVSDMASRVSAVAQVREHLLDLQRNLAKEHDVVMDGRDIGTTILPDAQVKFYLTASARERARRRMLELQEKGETASFTQVLDGILERDERDKNREASPLRKAWDAVVVDSSNMDPEEVVEEMIRVVEQKTTAAGKA